MLFSVCVYIIGNSLETIVKILVKGEFIDVSPSYVAFMKGISWLFPNLSAFDLKASLAYGLPIDPTYFWWTAGYGCAYTALMILLTLIIFKQKDIC